MKKAALGFALFPLVSNEAGDLAEFSFEKVSFDIQSEHLFFGYAKLMNMVITILMHFIHVFFKPIENTVIYIKRELLLAK